MSIDDYCWTADTLFSTINSTPFPFPDPREIGNQKINFNLNYFWKTKTFLYSKRICNFISVAKAGIADFIQPSLGPLQPNLDDFMSEIPLQGMHWKLFDWLDWNEPNHFFSFAELINNHLSSRLPPVPEEVTDESMYRTDVYDFPALMG